MKKIILLLPLLFIALCYAQNFEVWAERGGLFTIGKPEKIIIYVKNNGNKMDSYGILFKKDAYYQREGQRIDVSNLISFTLNSNKILNVRPNETKSTSGNLIILGPITEGSITITAVNSASQQKEFKLTNIKATYPQSLKEFNMLALILMVLISVLYLKKSKAFLILVFLLSFSLAESGYISITTYVDAPIIYKNSTEAIIKIENSGDEAAHDVVAVFESNKIYSGSIYIGKIDPGTVVDKKFSIFFTRDIKDGSYITAVKVYYKDINGYAFSAITPVQLVYKTFAPSKLSISLENVKVEENGNAKLHVKVRNLNEKLIDAKVNLFLPDEFSASKKFYEINLKPNSEKTVILEVSNLKALKGSTYPYFVSVEYEDQHHYSDYAVGFIQVIEKQKIKLTYILAGGALVISIIMFLTTKAQKRKR